MSISIKLLTMRDEIDEHWERINKFLDMDSSVYMPYHTKEEILHMIEVRTLEVWLLGEEGMVLTRTDLYRNELYKVLKIVYAFGEMANLRQAILQFMQAIEVVARCNGVHHIRVECGRIGWIQFLQGYYREQTVLGRDLS